MQLMRSFGRAAALVVATVAGPIADCVADAIVADQPPLRFCFCRDAAPRAFLDAAGHPQGVDVAVAKMLAAELDRPCQFHWCANDTCRLRNLKEKRCDVVLGLPDESVATPDTVWAKPYAAGKFGLLVTRRETAIRSLADLRGKRVGLVAGSVPLSSRNHKVVNFPSRQALLRDFRQAKLVGALVDTDFATWYLAAHPDLELRLVDEFISPYRWTLGIVLRAHDTALQQQLSRAVDACISKAKFSALFAKHGLVYRPPLADPQPKRGEVTEDTWQRIREHGAIIVSMDPANLPYSSADENKPGFDVEIAGALADRLDVELQLNWIDIHRETAIGQLLEYECDLAFGAAIDPNAMDDEEELAGKVIYSRPYYGTGYLLFSRQESPPLASLAELKGEESRRLGTQAGTIADYSLRQDGYQRRLFGTQLGVLHALQQGGIDYAYMWSNFAWMLHNTPEVNAKLVEGYVPVDRWNIAIAMRHGDSELKLHVDRALEKVMAGGLVAQAMRRYRMPYYAPFEVAHNSARSSTESATVSDIRQAPVDRGLEPNMSGRQRSRQRYSSLQSIRSRGTLVVGLDQNNLPFSAAHPQPAGLDYELAQLLAAKLDVALNVYWAYSSHDSYPSKLATKRQCDVMLGVMPDDRFAERVDFSQPYYYARYEYAEADHPDLTNHATLDGETALANLTIAIEPGVAIRGLANRNLQTYPDLSAVLSAVAHGEVAAGYVISSRAHWLAEQNWPGRIRFIRPQSSLDRFPICAAVRRDEVDLRDAIDTVWNELRLSGQLAETFARWHVPLGEP